jgi:hypothetical protein
MALTLVLTLLPGYVLGLMFPRSAGTHTTSAPTS